MQLIPFGSNCTPADILKVGGLRQHSLPFDWMFAYPDNIRRTLDTDFREWFDLQYLQAFNDDPNMIGRTWTKHSLYRAHTDEHIAGFFNHHDLTDEATRQMYQRRIDRFKDIISSDETVVFVTNSSKKDMQEQGLLDYFKRDSQTLFIFLDWHKSNNYSSKINKDTIVYTSPIQFNPRVGNMVSRLIKQMLNL